MKKSTIDFIVTVLSGLVTLLLLACVFIFVWNDGYKKGYKAGLKSAVDELVASIPVEELVEETVDDETEEEPIVDVPEVTEEIEAVATVNVAYDWEYVCRVITAEAGANEDLCLATAQCIKNGCRDTLLNPEELIDAYGYTSPSSWISDEAESAYERIILCDEDYEPVGDADVFYSTSGGFVSSWHERQQFVCQIGPVKYFVMGGNS